MSDRIIQAYYGEYPRINKRTPVDITSRVEADHFASLFEAIEDDCNLEPYGYTIGNYFESHNAHTVYQDTSSATESNTVKFRYWLAHPDLYYNGRDDRIVSNKHHLALVIEFNNNKRWNDGTFTGYENSRLHQWLKSSEALGNIKSDINYILGGSGADDHLLSLYKRFCTYSNNNFGIETSGNREFISALTEMDMFGAPILSRKESDQNDYQQGEAVTQLELFRKYHVSRILRSSPILRSVRDNTQCCVLNGEGYPSYTTFTNPCPAVGIILLKADPT